MDRILTIPNIISVFRLLCIPVFLWLLFGVDDEVTAAILLAVLGTTDWIDGYLARRLNQVTTFGTVFDPTVDRTLLVVAGVSLVVDGSMPLWFGIAALGRELLIVIGGIYLAMHGHQRLDVRYVGKVGAFGLMMSFPLFLVASGDISWDRVALVFAWICGAVGVVFSWYSLIGYYKAARLKLSS